MLRELATSGGERSRSQHAERLARAVGEDGGAILEALAGEKVRLLVPHARDDGLHYELAHDRLAQAVVEAIERDPTLGGEVDAEVVRLRPLVVLRTEQFASEPEQASRLSPEQFAAINRHREALLWSAESRDWWQACRERRDRERRRRRRLAAALGAFVLLLAVLSWWGWRLNRRGELLRDVLELRNPADALQSLASLEPYGPSAAALTDALEERRLADLLERGLPGLSSGSARNRTVLEAIRVAQSVLTPERERPHFVNLGTALWALDAFPGRDEELEIEATGLKRTLVASLGEAPAIPATHWVALPAGTFEMGSEEGDSDEQPAHQVSLSPFKMLRHEVTNGELRALLPGRPENSFPAAEVTWYQAYTFAAWVGGRLPTEAEWEYAARSGGKDRPYPWAEGPADCTRAVIREGGAPGCPVAERAATTGHSSPFVGKNRPLPLSEQQQPGPRGQ